MRTLVTLVLELLLLAAAADGRPDATGAPFVPTGLSLLHFLQRQSKLQQPQVKVKAEGGFEPELVQPVLPPKYYGEWRMYYYPFDRVEPPSWRAGRPLPPNAKSSSGRVWYDWANLRAVEQYDEICVPIFRPDNYFGCLQHEVNDTVYLVVLGERPHPYYGRCCRFKHPWHVFRPTVLAPMHYSHAAPLNGSRVDWWEFKFQDVPPFMWGFHRDRVASGYRWPAAFTFPGNVGWVEQDFEAFEADDRGYDYSVPPECRGAPDCVPGEQPPGPHDYDS